MSNYITTHDASGKAIFSTSIPREHHNFDLPLGKMSFIYVSSAFPTNVSVDDDIAEAAKARTQGLGGPGQICPPGGTSAALVSMAPGAVSEMHRTLTIGCGVVVEGTVEIDLDGGETARLQRGDTIVQRAGMHRWRNVTEGEGWAKMFFAAQGVEAPVIAGKTLEAEIVHEA
jgi:quercetin dioxygenase-like cupin family protein